MWCFFNKIFFAQDSTKYIIYTTILMHHFYLINQEKSGPTHRKEWQSSKLIFERNIYFFVSLVPLVFIIILEPSFLLFCQQSLPHPPLIFPSQLQHTHTYTDAAILQQILPNQWHSGCPLLSFSALCSYPFSVIYFSL